MLRQLASEASFEESVVAWMAAFLAVFISALVAVIVLGIEGVRRGDRPGDVTISAVMSRFQHPEMRCPAAVVTVRNPGPVPVLVGLTARRSWVPFWLHGDPLIVRVPFLTTRPRLLPARQSVVGVLAAGDAGRWLIPVPRGRIARQAVAVAGQAGGRLRVLARLIEPVPAPLAA